jgi:hypothetical protein
MPHDSVFAWGIETTPGTAQSASRLVPVLGFTMGNDSDTFLDQGVRGVASAKDFASFNSMFRGVSNVDGWGYIGVMSDLLHAMMGQKVTLEGGTVKITASDSPPSLTLHAEDRGSHNPMAGFRIPGCYAESVSLHFSTTEPLTWSASFVGHKGVTVQKWDGEVLRCFHWTPDGHAYDPTRSCQWSDMVARWSACVEGGGASLSVPRAYYVTNIGGVRSLVNDDGVWSDGTVGSASYWLHGAVHDLSDVYVAAFGVSGTQASKLYHSTNNGLTWDELSSYSASRNLWSFTTVRTPAQFAAVGLTQDVSSSYTPISITSDDGLTWATHAIAGAVGASVMGTFADPDGAFYITYRQSVDNTIYFNKSVDGATWPTQVSMGTLPYTGNYNASIIAREGHVFALYSRSGSESYLYYSHDDGQTWAYGGWFYGVLLHDACEPFCFGPLGLTFFLYEVSGTDKLINRYSTSDYTSGAPSFSLYSFVVPRDDVSRDVANLCADRFGDTGDLFLSVYTWPDDTCHLYVLGAADELWRLASSHVGAWITLWTPWQGRPAPSTGGGSGGSGGGGGWWMDLTPPEHADALFGWQALVDIGDGPDPHRAQAVTIDLSRSYNLHYGQDLNSPSQIYVSPIHVTFLLEIDWEDHAQLERYMQDNIEPLRIVLDNTVHSLTCEASKVTFASAPPVIDRSSVSPLLTYECTALYNVDDGGPCCFRLT